mmetsp:Transcript_1531/g.6037  ORF Transcript_1531/g.6037 Transcript_1531/m.6037 type:complete len:225 (+) Transcript_1531:1255-1929(+)
MTARARGERWCDSNACPEFNNFRHSLAGLVLRAVIEGLLDDLIRGRYGAVACFAAAVVVRASASAAGALAVRFVPALGQLAAPTALGYLTAQLGVVDGVVHLVAEHPVFGDLLLGEARVSFGLEVVVARLDFDGRGAVEARVPRLVHLVVQALHLHADLLEALVKLALIHAQALHRVECTVAHTRAVAGGDLLVRARVALALALALLAAGRPCVVVSPVALVGG